MYRIFLTSIIVVLASSSVLAAESADAIPLERFDDPDAKSTATGTTSRVVIEAGDADAKATLRVADYVSNATKDLHSRFSFTLTAPFDSKKADKVDVGTLSGLTSGTSASLEYGLLRWKRPDYDDANALSADCRKEIPNLFPGYDWETVGRVADITCGTDILEIDNLKAAVKKINAEREKCAKCQPIDGEPPPRCQILKEAFQQKCKPKKDAAVAEAEKKDPALCGLLESERQVACEGCEGGDAAALAICRQLAGKPKATVSKDAEKIIKRIEQGIKDRVTQLETPLHGVTLGLKANTQDFKYVLASAPTADPTSSSRTGAGVSLAYTRVGHSNLITFGYSHEQSYKAGSKVQVCSPIGTTGSTSCSEAVIGAPAKKTAELGFFEARRILSAAHFALAPRVEYDFKKSEWAARVPLYFIANKKHELTAGVTLGYTDADDEGFGASVFVSKAFAFFD